MKTFKTYILIAAAALATGGFQASATEEIPAVPVNNVKVQQNGTTISVAMDIDASNVKIGSGREVVLRPMIADANGNSAIFPAVYLAGKSNYYLHTRQNDIAAPDVLVRAKDAGVIAYSAQIPYQQWMEQSKLDMVYDYKGCACSTEDAATKTLAQLDYTPIVFTPEIVTMEAQAVSVKTNEISGSAYIDFPVNRMELYPDYRRNPEELAKIRATIDQVRNDPDATITSITIKGFASPDGPYANNERLAKGRTQTLVDYVQGLYSFDRNIMHSEWVAEDWAGLRDYVEKSDLEKRTAILELIDSDLAPDTKDARLRREFPKEYAFLLANVYPGLRHSDYAIEYEIRSFTDVNEIATVMKESPNKLSLNELYLLGESLDPQSDAYAEVYDLAVRMFPADPTANLNAAMSNIRRGNYEQASKFLDKAGTGDQVTYARGLIQAYNQQYDEALKTLAPVAAKLPEAAEAVAQIQKIMDRLANTMQ
ncbi:MAG: DUF3868 domain-containing protein [Muribaculaceae bacterium]|nr:DUF3868 domain-containing protein [Muribaculaceae bacterium]